MPDRDTFEDGDLGYHSSDDEGDTPPPHPRVKGTVHREENHFPRFDEATIASIILCFKTKSLANIKLAPPLPSQQIPRWWQE
jgi:hypothetical protein